MLGGVVILRRVLVKARPVAGQIIRTAETIERLSVQERNATRRLDALGSGAITFGHSPRDRDAEVVGFWCESSGDGKE